MKSIYSLFLAPLFWVGCSKQPEEIAQNCVPVAIYSDKFTADTVWLKTDTLYRACLSGRWLDTFKIKRGEGWQLPLCDTGYYFKLEYHRFEIYPMKTEPFKKQ